MDTEVNLHKDPETGEYEDLDNPGVLWQILGFSDDRHDCIVCDYPIEIGTAFGNLEDFDQNAHEWCVSVKTDKEDNKDKANEKG